MSETCWFCMKEFTPGEGKAYQPYVMDFHKVTEHTEQGKHYESKYISTRVVIPRCPVCVKKFGKWRWYVTGVLAIVGLVVGVILALTGGGGSADNIALVLGCPIAGAFLGFFSGGGLAKGYQGQKVLSFPAVKALLDAKWVEGKQASAFEQVSQ